MVFGGAVTFFEKVSTGAAGPNLGPHFGHGFPFRHGLEAVDMDGQRRVFGAWWDEEISQR